MKTIVLGVISVYRLVFSPILRGFFGNACKYNPTCSKYAYQSVNKYGVIKGLKKSFVRIINCH